MTLSIGQFPVTRRLAQCTILCLANGAIALMQLAMVKDFHSGVVGIDFSGWIGHRSIPLVFLNATMCALTGMVGAMEAVAQWRRIMADRTQIARPFQGHPTDQSAQDDRQQTGRVPAGLDVGARVAALVADIATRDEELAESVHFTARQLTFSVDKIDLAAARTLVDQGAVAAGDVLMEAMDANRTPSAMRSWQAARLYAPFDPRKAKSAYRKAISLAGIDTQLWHESRRYHHRNPMSASERKARAGVIQNCSNDELRISYHDGFGDMFLQEGDIAEARSQYVAGLATRQAMAENDPDNLRFRYILAMAYDRLGDFESAASDLHAARKHYSEAYAIRQQVTENHPHFAEWQHQVFSSFMKLGALERITGNPVAARGWFEQAHTLIDALVERHPHLLDFATDRDWVGYKLRNLD